jgi:hypothetical protein
MVRPQTCKGQFCPAHRFPSNHTCRTTPSTPASLASSSRFPAASSAGLAALKRAGASAGDAVRQATTQTKTTAKSNQGGSSTASGTGSTSKGGNMFHEIKTDRCEPSSSVSPTVTAIDSLSNRPRSIIPDPTKKWVPRSIFASA